MSLICPMPFHCYAAMGAPAFPCFKNQGAQNRQAFQQWGRLPKSRGGAHVCRGMEEFGLI
eukprot:6205246-Pleurochrysis_carterae.AAC.2